MNRTYTVNNLSQNTAYEFKLKLRNENGTGPYGNSSIIYTKLTTGKYIANTSHTNYQMRLYILSLKYTTFLYSLCQMNTFVNSYEQYRTIISKFVLLL